MGNIIHVRVPIIILFAALQCMPLVNAQAPAGPARPAVTLAQDDAIIRIDTDLLPFDLSVTDVEGRVMHGLGPRVFRLFEDNVEKPIAFFSEESKGIALRPVAVVFALDVSGSMSALELDRLRSGLHIFAQRMEGRSSSLAVITFGTQVKTLQSFTTDRNRLLDVLAKLNAEGDVGRSTRTYDAVDDAVRLLERKAPRIRDQQLVRRVVVVVTDGFPTGGTVDAATVIERANRAGVSIYTVTLPSYSLLSADARTPLPTLLDVSGLVNKTGGANFYASDDDFGTLFKALAEDVTSSYVLAFYPTNEKRKDGKFHQVRIEGPSGYVLRQNRPGYQSRNK